MRPVTKRAPRRVLKREVVPACVLVAALVVLGGFAASSCSRSIADPQISVNPAPHASRATLRGVWQNVDNGRLLALRTANNAAVYFPGDSYYSLRIKGTRKTGLWETSGQTLMVDHVGKGPYELSFYKNFEVLTFAGHKWIRIDEDAQRDAFLDEQEQLAKGSSKDDFTPAN